MTHEAPNPPHPKDRHMQIQYPKQFRELRKDLIEADAIQELQRRLELFGPLGMASEESMIQDEKTKVKTTRSEASIKKSIRNYLKKIPTVKCFNNGVGYFEGHSYGLGKKTSDLIGIINKTVNGVSFGVFFAIEVKEECWTPPKQGTKAHKHYEGQCRFLNRINELGGLAGFATSKEDARRILRL